MSDGEGGGEGGGGGGKRSRETRAMKNRSGRAQKALGQEWCQGISS